MSKCLDCKYYDPQCHECTKDDHCPYADINNEACDKFEQRKQCKHRYENCDINGCSIICHRCPSECGCDFYYQCKLDGYYCDENCKPHELRHELEHEKENLHKMFDTKRFMEKMIEETELKIEKLENEVKNI